MAKSYLDSDGLARLWGKIKGLFSSNASYIPTQATLTDVSGFSTGARVNTSGVLATESNTVYTVALLTDLGLKEGDKLVVSARQTYNSNLYLFVVSFFNKTTTDPETGTTTIEDVAIGDTAIQFTGFSYQGALADVGEVTVPTDATHICLSHSKNSSAAQYQQCLEVRKTQDVDTIGTYAEENDLLYNWRNKYSYRANGQRVIRGDNGAVYSSAYGSAGVYYAINDYIDVRYVKELVYRLGCANAGPSGVGGICLMAAYDADKTYIAESSVVRTSAGNLSGTWVRPSNVCYVRFTICTTRGEYYCVDPDRIGTLERMATATAGGATANDDWKEGILSQGASITFPSTCYGSVKIISSTDGNGHGAVTREILVDMPNSTTVVASKYPSTSDDDSITVQTGEVVIEDGTAQYVCKLNVKPTFEGDVIFTGNSPEANMEGVVFASDGAAMSAGDVNILTSTNVLTIVKLTQAAYDALEEKDEQTLYVIV